MQPRAPDTIAHSKLAAPKRAPDATVPRTAKAPRVSPGKPKPIDRVTYAGLRPEVATLPYVPNLSSATPRTPNPDLGRLAAEYHAAKLAEEEAKTAKDEAARTRDDDQREKERAAEDAEGAVRQLQVDIKEYERILLQKDALVAERVAAAAMAPGAAAASALDFKEKAAALLRAQADRSACKRAAFEGFLATFSPCL